MSAANVASIIRVPADLVWNPTTFPGGSAPWGGTYLGLSRDKEFIPEPQLRPIWAEEMGTWTDVIYCGEKVTFKAVLRYPDSDALDAIAASAISSGSSGGGFRFRPGGTTGNTRAGTSLFGDAGKLLVSARATVDHPMLILYNAVPSISEDARLKWAMNEEYGLEVVFYGTPDSSGRVYACARRANLSI